MPYRQQREGQDAHRVPAHSLRSGPGGYPRLVCAQAWRQEGGVIRLIRPYISFDEVEADFRQMFADGIFTRGRHVEELRREVAIYCGSQRSEERRVGKECRSRWSP